MPPYLPACPAQKVIIGTSALEGLTTHQVGYRFFDTEVVIRSDSDGILARFDEIYGRFRTGCTVGRAPTCYVLTGDQPFGQPALVLNGETHLTNKPGTLFDYAHTVILNAALARIRSHFLVHGAALSMDGAGVVLAGGAGYGKTTLALELIRRGFRFLSDDIAAIARIDHRLHPFPKSLGIWPRTGQLIPGIGRHLEATAGRQLVDVEALCPHRLGDCCPPGCLVVLVGSASDREQADGAVYLTVDRATEALLADLMTVPGVGSATVARGQELPVIRLSLPRRAFIEPAVETVCHRHRILIFDVAKEQSGPLDFDRSPRLEPLPKAEAVLELFRKLRGGWRSALLRHEFEGSASRLYLALGELVAKMACHRLVVGRLQETADLVCQAVSGRVG